jgi:hypothetical protein
MLSLRRKPFDCLAFEAGWAKYETCGVEKLYPGIAPILLPNSFQIDLSQTHPNGVSDVTGFYSPEQDGVWSIGPVANINLAADLPSKFDLILTAFTFPTNSESGIDIIIGKQKRRIILGNEMTTKIIRYVFKGDDAGSLIQFEIPHPASPSEIDKKSTDTRKLGIFIKTLRIVSLLPNVIDFRNLNMQSGLKRFSGFSIQEPAGRWTEGFISSLVFDKQLPAHFKLLLRASTLPPNVGKSATILVGKSEYALTLINGTSDYELDIKTNPLIHEDKIELAVPFAISPKEIGLNADPRRLGIFLEEAVITPLKN